MQHIITIKATQHLKFAIEAPTIEEAQACALTSARSQFKLVELVDIQDADWSEIPTVPALLEVPKKIKKSRK